MSGTNFLIYLKDDNGDDEYMCKVFYSLSSDINILEIYMNSVLIVTQALAPLQQDPTYDHKIDPIFQKVNEFATKIKSVRLTMQILYVNKVKKANDIDTFFQFQIVYEQNSFITANYFSEGPKNG